MMTLFIGKDSISVTATHDLFVESGSSETENVRSSSLPNTASSFQNYQLSKESAPPSFPTDAVGRVVMYEYWLSGFKGNSIDGSIVYERSVQTERKQWNQYRSFIAKITRDRSGCTSSSKINPKKRKLKEIKKPNCGEPPSFKMLPMQEQNDYNSQAEKFREVGYFIIQNVELPIGPVQEESREESMKSRAGTMSVSSQRNCITFKDAQVEMFESHYQSFELAKAYFERKQFNRHKSPILRIPWTQLMTHATWFSPHDVSMTGCLSPLPSSCCVSECQNVDLTACDGAVLPGIGPASAPCQRNAICNECRKTNSYRGTSSWLCPSCLTEEATYETMYGYATPALNSSSLNDDVRALGAPVLELQRNSKLNPAEWYDLYTKKQSPHMEDSGFSGAKEMVGEIFGTALDTAGLSRKQQTSILSSLHELHKKGLVDLKGNMPLQPRTLHKRKAENAVDSICKLETISVRFDSSGVLQGQKSVLLQRFNPLEVTQLLIMNEDIPYRSRYYGDGEPLIFADGEKAVGGPAWCNEAYIETCARFPKIPLNRRVLVVGFGADKTEASSLNTWPFFLKLFNISEEFTSLATSLVALLPVSKKRKPKGGEAEGMSEEQLRDETQIIQDSYAHILKEFEEANLEGGVLVRYPDGVYTTYFGCISNNEDLAGKKDVATTNFFHCTCCFTSPQNYGSSHESHICGAGPLGARTPKKVLALLRSVCLEQSIHTLTTEAKVKASQLGLKRFAVKNQLLAFTNFFGDKGVYDCMHFDDLHMMFLGLFKLILILADFCFVNILKERQPSKL